MSEVLICYVPDCKKEIPAWRVNKGRITCSKKCSNAWNWVSKTKREEIRGAKYNRK